LKWFSERKGIKKPRTEIQVNSIDDALRNRLWNVFEKLFLRSPYSNVLHAMQNVMEGYFDVYLKQKTDLAPYDLSDIRKFVGAVFSKADWQTVHDFLEFFVAYFPYEEANNVLIAECNAVLESELSAYRFVGKCITELTSEEEISVIEEALETPFKAVRAHFETALKLMSDKKDPDYRNSIKESISAVEAICRLVANNKNATLGDALDIIEKQGKIKLHGALRKAFDSLYGYTSSAEGIRHAFTDEKVSVSFEDAKFMLVSCSAFVNHIVSKASKAGIKIG
jgi:hypothetical protein